MEDQTVQIVFPPLDLAYQAAVLEQAGHECRIEDYPVARRTWNDYENDLRTFRPDLVIIAATEPTLENDMVAAQVAREICGDSWVAARGEIFLTRDQEILGAHQALDFVCWGECDPSIVALANGADLHGLNGITWRSNGNLNRNPEPELLDNLNDLPLPARHLLRNELYVSPVTRRPMTTVQTARGCPAKCIFCPVPVLYGTKVRYRTPENIVEELEDCLRNYHIDEFLFHADTFTLHKRWVIKICRLILDKNLKIRWYANSRVDTIDGERLEWMKKAGCQVIGFGIECGSDKGLENMRKGATVEQARKAIALCREHGIKSHAFFSFGFPWDTKETLDETLTFARELDPDFFDFNIAFPLPGTELHNWVRDKNLLVAPKDGKNRGYATAQLRTETVDPEYLEQFRKKALWNMYLRPHYIARTVIRAGSVGVAFNLMRAAASRARRLLTH